MCNLLRWKSRHNTVFALKYRYKDVLKSLTNIMLTSDKKKEMNRAEGLKKKLESFEFVLILIMGTNFKTILCGI